MKTIAVLGLGSIGMRHALNLQACGARVIGFDPNGESRAKFQASGGLIAGTRDAALAEACAAVIASPSRFHLEDLAAAAAAGCHVLAEKPLAHTVDGVSAILERFEAQNRTVFAGFNLRLHPVVSMARQWLDEGRLGTLMWARLQMSDYLPGWRPHQDYRQGYASDATSGGVLFDMIHEFDLANYLLGPARVATAVARNSGFLDVAAEDIADVVLCHDKGVNTSLHLDYVSRPRQRVSEICGSEGRIDIDLDARRIVLTDVAGSAVEDQILPGNYGDDYRREAELFLACIDGSAVPTCDGWQALRVLEQVIDARQKCQLPQV